MRPDSPIMAAPRSRSRSGQSRRTRPRSLSRRLARGVTTAGSPGHLHTGHFWLTRIVLLKAQPSLYFVAFLVAFHQNKQLIGDRGLLPCRVFLKNFQHYFQDRTSWEVFSYRPPSSG
ncbi:LMF1 isoform 17 [Pongo abelii]|uniref:LMF1 isoform 15 n=1 Tax=Pongo abelii TaxID=9601 RepID=A0A2J8QZE9_PONAB|nr:LMF1 isoform 15 [Pongo abelii]PNJ01643.1 LMF1 isoform 16 [Pongo abelii]PNJ01644.1 LMF1 isoform 17 [Pongo abelii]